MATVTVETTVKGEKISITITEVGTDGAELIIRTFTPSGAVKKSDRVELYAVKRVKNQNAIRCKAKAPGPDPDVTCTLEAGSGPTNRVLHLVVKGTLASLGDRDERYPITEAHYQNGVTLIAASSFPVK